MAEKKCLLNILLVEDDMVDRMNIKRAFRKQNIEHTLIEAADGKEALEILRNKGENVTKDPLLILLDINMPRMNGIEFLQELRQDHRLCFLPVVVLTTSDEENDIVRAYGYNVAGYIVKPAQPEEFPEILSVINQYWKNCEIPLLHFS